MISAITYTITKARTYWTSAEAMPDTIPTRTVPTIGTLIPMIDAPMKPHTAGIAARMAT